MKFGSAEIANYSNRNLHEIPLHDSPDGIRYVNLAGNRPVDLDHSAISQFPNVQYLDLSSNKITTISSLAGLSQLAVLF
jgi:Leucine-rich repeat (LRR) protein